MNFNAQPAQPAVRDEIVSAASREMSRYYASCRLAEEKEEEEDD
jgi:hypothetical protein